MTRTVCIILTAIGLIGPSTLASARQSNPAATAFDKLKALDGEWIDVDGALGAKGKVGAIYKVTSGGTAVIERFPIGSAEEMTTMYYRDGDALVLTHYCSVGNQPRMRARTFAGDTLSFEFEGGANIDPKTTEHMHSVRFEFVSKDEIKAVWENWTNGKSAHTQTMRLTRKKS